MFTPEKLMIPEFPERKFRNRQNQLKTRRLFVEDYDGDAAGALYTLKDEDYKGFPSLRRLYLEEADPTEYRFAVKYFESYTHWEKIQALGWMNGRSNFGTDVSDWRKELELRIRSAALVEVQKMAAQSGREALQANKILLQGGWKPPAQRTRGAPSKEEIHAAATQIASDNKRIEEDAVRLSLVN